MMKVLIIVGSSLRYCPYANFYIDILNENGIDFDVAFPNRANLNDHYSFSTIEYNWNDKRNKCLELLNYRKFILNVIKKESYDCVITMTTVISILFYRALKKMKIDYIVDIRDYTYEKYKLFYYFEKKAIKGAKRCFISSPGFRKFLPQDNYIDLFNAPNELSVTKRKFNKNGGDKPISISYIGTIAYPEQCEYLMRLVEKDKRFIFNLYGNDLNGDRISSFIRDNNLKRSRCFGGYKPIEKPEIIDKSDILFNAYGNNSELLLYALSNKLTDAVLYIKPVLNSPGTSMHEMLEGISFAIDLKNESSLDGLYNWYISLDNSAVEKKACEILLNIINTNSKAKKMVISTLEK